MSQGGRGQWPCGGLLQRMRGQTRGPEVIPFQESQRTSISISRKKISKHKYEGHTFISSESLPRCSIDGFYDKLQRDLENGERGFCSHKYKKFFKREFVSQIYAERDNKLKITRVLLPIWTANVLWWSQ